MTEKVVKGYECKFVTYIPNKDPYRDDYYIVKENIHYTDGSIKPNIRVIKNYQRPFWVTKKSYQNHQSKKEWEKKERLTEFQCKDSEFGRKVAKALGKEYLTDQSIRSLSRSPYLYGTDIKSTSLIKHDYSVKFPDLVTNNTICAFDIETDVSDDNMGKVIIISACMKDKVVCVINKDFILGIPDVERKVREKISKYIGDYIDKRKMKVYIEIESGELKTVQKVFEYIHKWKPDFLSIWNINFDLPKIVEALQRNDVDPADVFSDPSLPDHLKYFHYREGPSIKVKANGDTISLKPADRWHVAKCSSSFYFIDAMCVYRLVRLGIQEKPSYSLDSILDEELGIRKLSFKEADNYSGLQKHKFLQTNYKAEYIVYNIFDTISMLELEEKTNDLSQSISVISGFSDFSNFNSQPRRIVDQLHFDMLELDHVMGSTADNIREDVDDQTLPLTGWIITLAPHLIVDNGISMISEDKNIKSNVRLYVSD